MEEEKTLTKIQKSGKKNTSQSFLCRKLVLYFKIAFLYANTLLMDLGWMPTSGIIYPPGTQKVSNLINSPITLDIL